MVLAEAPGSIAAMRRCTGWTTCHTHGRMHRIAPDIRVVAPADRSVLVAMVCVNVLMSGSGIRHARKSKNQCRTDKHNSPHYIALPNCPISHRTIL